MLKYKIDIVKTLREHGYSTARIRKEKLIAECSLTKTRHGIISLAAIESVCKLTGLQVGDIIEYVPDEQE